MPDLSDRHLALQLATKLHYLSFPADPDKLHESNLRVRSTATALWHWLTGPATLLLRAVTIRDADGTTYPITRNEGGAVQLRIADAQGRPYAVDLTVEVRDAKGNVITDDPNTSADDMTWALESGDGVVTTAVSGDTRTCTVTAAQLGSAVLRVGIGELTATDAFDVIAGDAAAVTIVEGTPYPVG